MTVAQLPKRCAICSEPIRGVSVIGVNGKPYHPGACYAARCGQARQERAGR